MGQTHTEDTIKHSTGFLHLHGHTEHFQTVLYRGSPLYCDGTPHDATLQLVQTGSTTSVTSGTFDRESQFSEKPVLRAILQTASGLRLTAPPTLGAACCLLIGWLWEDQEVDFWKVEWKSLIRSWKRRLTWRRQNSSPIRRIKILRETSAFK